MGTFHFRLDQKFPGILNPVNGDRGLEYPQIPSKNSQTWGWGFGIFEAEKSPNFLGILYSRDF